MDFVDLDGPALITRNSTNARWGGLSSCKPTRSPRANPTLAQNGGRHRIRPGSGGWNHRWTGIACGRVGILPVRRWLPRRLIPPRRGPTSSHRVRTAARRDGVYRRTLRSSPDPRERPTGPASGQIGLPDRALSTQAHARVEDHRGSPKEALSGGPSSVESSSVEPGGGDAGERGAGLPAAGRSKASTLPDRHHRVGPRQRAVGR
jgi:hypothetical protein